MPHIELGDTHSTSNRRLLHRIKRPYPLIVVKKSIELIYAAVTLACPRDYCFYTVSPPGPINTHCLVTNDVRSQGTVSRSLCIDLRRGRRLTKAVIKPCSVTHKKWRGRLKVAVICGNLVHLSEQILFISINHSYRALQLQLYGSVKMD